MTNKITIAGVALLSLLLWLSFRSPVKQHAESDAVDNALRSVQKRSHFPRPIESALDQEYLATSNEIIKAYIQEKKEVEWSNIWTQAETPPGNRATFKGLLKLSQNGYKQEVKSLFLRVAYNTNYPSGYRGSALNCYHGLNDFQLEDESIPILITFLYGVTNSSSEAQMNAILIRPLIPPEQWARFIPYLESLPADKYNKKAIADLILHVQGNLARMSEKHSNP